MALVVVVVVGFVRCVAQPMPIPINASTPKRIAGSIRGFGWTGWRVGMREVLAGSSRVDKRGERP